MKAHRSSHLLACFVLAGAACLCSDASAETIGSPLQQREFKDRDPGQVYIYVGTSSPFQIDAVASSFSFYDTTTPGGGASLLAVTAVLVRRRSRCR